MAARVAALLAVFGAVEVGASAGHGSVRMRADCGACAPHGAAHGGCGRAM